MNHNLLQFQTGVILYIFCVVVCSCKTSVSRVMCGWWPGCARLEEARGPGLGWRWAAPVLYHSDTYLHTTQTHNSISSDQTLVSCHTSDDPGTYKRCQLFKAFIWSTDSTSSLSSTCISLPSSAYSAYFTARTAWESLVLRSSAILADFFSMVALHPSW